MTTELLYHADLYLPRSVSLGLPFKSMSLLYSNHAIAASKNDRYGTFELPATLEPQNAKVIEVAYSTETKKVVKVVYRQQLDSQRDICIAVAIDPRKGYVVKTVWINLASDSHRSLDASKYVAKAA